MADQDTESRRAADDYERSSRDDARPASQDIEVKHVATVPDALPAVPSTAVVARRNTVGEVSVSATFELRTLTLDQIWGLANIF
jgi:hypothetical protein